MIISTSQNNALSSTNLIGNGREREADIKNQMMLCVAYLKGGDVDYKSLNNVRINPAYAIDTVIGPGYIKRKKYEKEREKEKEKER